MIKNFFDKIQIKYIENASLKNYSIKQCHTTYSNALKILQKEIGSLDSEIGGLKTNIRNISSAMKTLTLGAY